MSETGQMTTEKGEKSRRVLFLPDNPHDAETAREVFDEYDIDIWPVESFSELVEEARRDAGCLLLVEEALHSPEFDGLIRLFEQQPEWSDLPVIITTRKGSSSQRAWHLTEIANVTLIESPIPTKMLISVVRSALRDRHRQYEIRQSIANRDNFLAMVGHELRNPLTSISLATHLLDDTENGAVDLIKRQVHNLKRIVDDLLEVSQIRQGVISFDILRLDLFDVIQNTADAFAPIADAQELELSVKLPDAPLWVDADAGRLGQVLGNLLSNAIRYTEEGRIVVEARRHGEFVVVSVRDTGIGIEPDKLDEIFDLFSRINTDSGARDQKKGLGLGLNLAYNIVQIHEGKLVAESAGEGKGSTISVYLPAADPPAISTDTHRPPAP